MAAGGLDPGELRLGVVGFGRVVRRYYLQALRALSGARVVAVADTLEESRVLAAKRLPGVEVFAGHRQMLDGPRLDGVIVASPPSTHFEVWSDAAARGIAALVEKPLLLSSQLAELDPERIEPRLMIDFNRRFWPPYRRVGELVRERALGTPVHLDLLFHLDVLAWSRVTRHRLTPGEGGLLHDLGSHAIDLAGEILGEEPEGVAAEPSSLRWPDDHLRLRLVYPGSSSATCELAYGRRTRERLVARGPEAVAWLTDPNMALHVGRPGASRRSLATWGSDAATVSYRALRRSQAMGRASIAAALTAFVDSLRTGKPFSPGFDEGTRNARWVAAAAQSAAEGGSLRRP